MTGKNRPRGGRGKKVAAGMLAVAAAVAVGFLFTGGTLEINLDGTIPDVSSDMSNIENVPSMIRDAGETAIEMIPEIEEYMMSATPRPEYQTVTIPEMRQHMLELINAERASVGLVPVKLGYNPAAQIHAEDMLENCFAGHWGTDGLKPYMRYSLSGGYQSNAENVSGLDYCIKSHENYMVTQPKQDVREAVTGFMASPGHRDNMLDPHHRTVNIGIAWDRHNMKIVQHFEHAYIHFDGLPSMEDGVLSFSAVARNINFAYDITVSIAYDPPPHSLTPGQIASTYCYSYGRMVVAILEPPEPGSFYVDDSYMVEYTTCPDPYDVPPETPAPTSPMQALKTHEDAKRRSQEMSVVTHDVPFLVAYKWNQSPTQFDMNVDIGDVLEKHGSGVYTVMIGGFEMGKYVSLSEYSIFHEMDYPWPYPDPDV